jgi:hypothetical protein
MPVQAPSLGGLFCPTVHIWAERTKLSARVAGLRTSQSFPVQPLPFFEPAAACIVKKKARGLGDNGELISSAHNRTQLHGCRVRWTVHATARLCL